MEKIKPSEIKSLTPIGVLDNEKIENRFVSVVNKMTKSDVGAQIFAREQQWFKRIMTETPDLMKCTPTSVFSAFMDVATLGLSVAKGTNPLAYLIPYNIKVNKGTPQEYTEKRLQLEVSPYGELAMRENFGQIKHADNPVIVYEHEKDFFRDYTKEGQRYIDYERKPVPAGQKKRIYAGFIRVVRMDNTVDYHVMDMSDIERLKGYSERKNFGKANRLYTSNDGQIDEGFFVAKLIKHAFRSYPKSPYMQLIGNAVMQTEKEDADLEELKNLTSIEEEAATEVEDADVTIVQQEENEDDNMSY